MMSKFLTTALQLPNPMDTKKQKTRLLSVFTDLASSLHFFSLGVTMISMKQKIRAPQDDLSKLRWVYSALILSLVFSVTACAPRRNTTPASSSNTTSSNTTTSTTNESTGTVTTNETTSEPSVEPLPAITESFTVSGASGTTPSYTTTVDTDNVLRVKVTAEAAGQVTDPTYGFSGTYSCVSYKVTVLGSTQTTKLLAVGSNTDLLAGYNCPGAAGSQILDFSSRLTPGHGTITIKVEASTYDFYCRGCESSPWLYNAYPYGPYSCSLYCPSRPVYKTHSVTGTLSIQVNGTHL